MNIAHGKMVQGKKWNCPIIPIPFAETRNFIGASHRYLHGAMSSFTVCRGWFRGAVQLSKLAWDPVYCLKNLAAYIHYFYLHWVIWYADSIISINSYNRISTFDSCFFLNLIISGKYFRFGYICSRSWTTFKGFEIYISNHPWLVSSHLIS